ncbi:LytR C-terminal domain-containing protein, partial [Crenalkalicoccus roseus]|uniref:LytR C-terminal domain-containing protein n=1 Tax=Crenalkalicoccus roseus TaxID=1485588 RepID=UPI00186512C3
APAAPPPPAPAAASPPRPAAATPRVFVHYRAGSDTAREAAEAAARALRGGGFQVTELRGVPGVPTQRVVRYFHDDDAAAAARLAGRLGRGWVIQDFRAYEPSPAPQTLEVWLPER